jgi:hypothetical protein
LLVAATLAGFALALVMKHQTLARRARSATMAPSR